MGLWQQKYISMNTRQPPMVLIFQVWTITKSHYLNGENIVLFWIKRTTPICDLKLCRKPAVLTDTENQDSLSLILEGGNWYTFTGTSLGKRKKQVHIYFINAH